MFAAIIGDSISSGSGKKFTRFISCLMCFACSTLSLWIHHKLTTRAVNVDYLNTETKGWLAKYTKPSKSKKKKRKVKSSVKITLFLSHFFSNFVNLIPVTAVAICMLIGSSASSWCNGSNGSYIDKYFFSIATVLRYAAWYPTMIIAHLFLFPRRQRLKMVI
ncbi:hypothetical protein A6V39_04825 [Candidatus Mycoplasma haematobovis]|uniref:Uncharacterized protein n=1 Tax=Candidatus Mycoplasma haematobovis TaxID=432608 RepID=A0A1A9QDU6_9MOLU|nr:hypothetical protein [Candidatus Mycoplasma haematobovis]OAL09869.1 hypothetical protein A6V39_04825 [Candidatus Mycoplasma haematobovis]